jgi:4a-hydroxytetrahydrobiopterin dehydratase
MPLVKYLGENRIRDVQSSCSSVSRILEGISTTIPDGDLPVRAETSDWQTRSGPERLFKVFEFLKFSHLDYFVNETLKYQEYNQHHCKMIISHRLIEIETYTLDISRITQQDLNLAKFCDELYEDIKYFVATSEDEE